MNTEKTYITARVLHDIEGMVTEIGFGIKNLGVINSALLEEIVTEEDTGEALCCCIAYLTAAEKKLTQYIQSIFDTLKKGGTKA